MKNIFRNHTAIILTLVGILISACSGGGGSTFPPSTSNNSDPATGSDSSNTDGGSTNNQIPVAVADEIITGRYDPISINILANDFGLGDAPITISVPNLPDYGDIAVDANNFIIFTPNSDFIGRDSFTYAVTDNNGDISTAIVTLDIRGESTARNQIPIAVADEVITDAYDPITINILSNDFGLGDLPITISIPTLPGFGNLAVESDNSITFSPNSGYIGNDSFTYLVTDKNGDSATASVFLDIRCTNCQSNTPQQTLLTLYWEANSDKVDGYIVNYGSTAIKANQTASTIFINTPGFDAVSPSIEFDVATDLSLLPNDAVCFTIRAFNVAGQSAPSAPVCTII